MNISWLNLSIKLTNIKHQKIGMLVFEDFADQFLFNKIWLACIGRFLLE